MITNSVKDTVAEDCEIDRIRHKAFFFTQNQLFLHKQEFSHKAFLTQDYSL